MFVSTDSRITTSESDSDLSHRTKMVMVRPAHSKHDPQIRVHGYGDPERIIRQMSAPRTLAKDGLMTLDGILKMKS